MFFIQSAHAQAAGGAPQQGAGMFNLLLMIGIFAVMWFLMIRPQQKRAKEQRAMIAALKKGDEVMTNGGLMGRIINLDEQAIDLEIAKGTIVRFQRNFVVQVLPKGSLKAELGSVAVANDEPVELKKDETEENK
ncbi:preprotein translocase subunit YajC [Suttonella ornithocola]|uniref:Sec translocon accessory complex subunit YajC n=1 Tax=Suttonella ornithocola TaxID=279832 RepID=A0A380MSF6_9GAMM|nr:preprotein translocase subunit YajC [Suttonella ornithocola]SUO95559.1 preprotein translocase subunit YajC [Suttonella ornithocola]